MVRKTVCFHVRRDVMDMLRQSREDGRYPVRTINGLADETNEIYSRHLHYKFSS